MALKRHGSGCAVGAIACLLVLMLPETAAAAAAKVGVGPIDAVTQAVVHAAKGWIPVLQNYARGAFVGLAVIQMAWIGVRHALSSNPDLGGAIGAAALEFVTLGFFAVLISEGPGWAEAIVLSLQEAGRVAAGGAAGETPQQILDEIAALGVRIIEDLSLLNAITSGLAMAIGSLGLLLLTALIAGLILVGWVQAWVVVGAGSILLGLGGSSWTRPLATNYLRHALGAGIKLMVLELLSGVLLGHVKAWVDEANGGVDFGLELLVHVLLSLTVMAIMILSVPSYVSSIVTGAVMNGGEAMLTRAAAAAAFFAAGTAMNAGRAGKVGASSGAAQGAGGLVSPATAAPGLVGSGGARASAGGGVSGGGPGSRASAVQTKVSLAGGSAGEGGESGAPAATGTSIAGTTVAGGSRPAADAAATRTTPAARAVGHGRSAAVSGFGGERGDRPIGTTARQGAGRSATGREGVGAAALAEGARASVGGPSALSSAGVQRVSGALRSEGLAASPASATSSPASASGRPLSPGAVSSAASGGVRSTGTSGGCAGGSAGAKASSAKASAGPGAGSGSTAPGGPRPRLAGRTPTGESGSGSASRSEGAGPSSHVSMPAGASGGAPAPRPSAKAPPGGTAPGSPRHTGPTRLELAMSGEDHGDEEGRDE